MLYVKEVVVPAGTQFTSPVEEHVHLEEDYITRVEVQFPAGVHNEVYVALFYGEQQIFPSTKGQWVTGNNETVGADVTIPLYDRPTKVTIRAASPNADYDHTVLVRISTSKRYYVDYPFYLYLIAKYLAGV